MDYRALLKKYIEYILEIEGVDYLGSRGGPSSCSAEETNALQELVTELIAEGKRTK